jgi:hypothetical protein
VEICTNLLQHAGIKKKTYTNNETTPKLKSDGREKEILGV